MVTAGMLILRQQATGIWLPTGMDKRNLSYQRQYDMSLLLNFENYTMTLFTGKLSSVNILEIPVTAMTKRSVKRGDI